MKMKQISDTTLKITMSLEDLMDRGMEIADFLVPQEKTEEFFYAILDELEMPDSFLDTGMLSFRVTPKPDKVDVFVTKSKIDQNLDFEDLADLPDMDELAKMSPDEFLKTLEKTMAEKTKEDIEAWWKKEPLVRMRNFLTEKGLWDTEKEEAYIAELDAGIDADIKKANNVEKQKISSFIKNTLEVPSQAMAEQIAKFESEGK